MKAMLLLTSRPIRLLFLCALVSSGAALSSCTTTAPSTDTSDTMIYPTPAEKNQRMQEQMSQVTRTLM